MSDPGLMGMENVARSWVPLSDGLARWFHALAGHYEETDKDTWHYVGLVDRKSLALGDLSELGQEIATGVVQVAEHVGRASMDGAISVGTLSIACEDRIEVRLRWKRRVTDSGCSGQKR